jgi:hypothetical protein
MTGARRSGTVAALAAVGLVMAGCGSGGGKKAATPATTTPDVTVTTAPLKSSLGASGSGSATGGSCPAIASAPGAATSVTTAKVDFDGNGTPDTLRVYLVGSAWHARGDKAGTAFDDEVIDGPGPMEAFGGAKVNADATQEAWVKTGQGGAGDILSFFVYSQCRIRQVRLNGAAANFPLGLGPTATAGVSCFGSGVGLVLLDTMSTDGVNYSGTSKLYKLSLGPPPSLVLAQTTPESASSSPGGPAFDALSSFHCGNLSD